MSKFFSKVKGKNRKRVVRKTKRTGTLEWMDFDENDLEDEEWEEESFEDDDSDDEYEDDEYEDDEYEDDEDDDPEEDDPEEDEYEDEDDSDEVEEIEEIEEELADDDEEYEDDEYEDDEDYEDEDDEDIDDEDEYYDEDDEDIDDEDYDEEDDEGYYYEDEPRGFKKIIYFIENMSMVDHVVILTGVLVLALSVVVGTLYLGAKSDEKEIAAFAEIGEGLEGIPVIGESGLLAIADAQAAKVVAEELEVIEEEATQVDDETGKIEVVMNLTSIQKDLKIKFTNKKSGKLIPNVPFVVEIISPSGDTYSLKDEDQDGIIYQKDIASGKYKVAITGPADLQEYSFSSEPVSITVRDTIEYKKVEVADEIKTEAQVNVAVEDTAVNDTVVESTNTDTVEWVESTKTLIEGTETTSESFEKVERKDITDPGTKTAVGFRLLTEGTPAATPGNDGDSTPEPVETAAPEPVETAAPGPIETATPKPEKTATPEPEETATPTPKPTQEPTKEPVATSAPTSTSTAAPTSVPTVAPSVTPSATPTATPTATPSASPTATPKASPSSSPSGTPTASPGNSAKTDTKTDLKSNSGEKLYVKDSNGNFREAKYADYYDDGIKEFYKKVSKTTGEYRYTGWQTIDGATYFFDKNGNKVTGEQIIQGAKYTFNDNGVLNTGSGHMGIDVSKWNGNIDWNAVKNSGVSYAIIRCGYRGSTTGALIEDPKFHANIQGAQNAGIKVGVYFFTQAMNEVEAVEEASMVLSLIKGYNISYPVFLDVEPSNGRADTISADTRTAVCNAFCQTIQNSGYKAGIYANKTWFNEKMNTPSLTGYKLWLAQYAATPTYTRTKYDLWQYSSKGRVSGIGTDVDMNISYLGY